MTAGWGFSCFIDDGEQKVLFDTGDNGPALLGNLKKLDILPEKIDKIVISHEHHDHFGGLFDLLSINNRATVFVPFSFSDKFKIKIRQKTKLVEVTSPQEISQNIYSTGLIENNPDEQSLILKTIRGIGVVVGCSHPGVGRILKIAKKYGNIYGIVGGFHEFSNYNLLEGIEVIGACHCTQHIKEINENFPEQFEEIKAGDSLEWD